jgi:hypothetical protein
MRLLDIDDRYSLVNYINEDCISSYKMKANMERIDEQFFKPWARYLEETALTQQQITQIFQAAHKEAQASGANSTMLGKVVEKIIPDSMLQKLSDSLPEPDPNAANDPQFANKAGAAVNQLPVDAETKSGLMKVVANAAKNPAVQPMILSLVGGVLGGLVQKVGPSLNAMGLPGTLVAGVAGALVAGGVAVAAAKIQGKSWKDSFKGAIKPALAGAAGAVLGKLAADFVGGIGSGGDKAAAGQGGDIEAGMAADQAKQDALLNKYPPDQGYTFGARGNSVEVFDANGNKVFTGDIPLKTMDAQTFADLTNQGKMATPGVSSGAAASDPLAGTGLEVQNDRKVGRIDWDAEAGQGAAPTTQKFSGVTVANEPVIPGQPLSPQQMAVVDMSKSMGNTPSPEVQAAYDLAKQGGGGGVQAAQASSNYRTLPDDPTGMGADSDYKPVDTGSLRQGGAPGGVAFPGDPGYVPPEKASQQQLNLRPRFKPQTQSREYLGNRLTEGQCYLLMKRVAVTNRDMILEGYLVLEAGMLQKAGTWLKTKAQNITQQVTADKLMTAWKKAGSPMDSNAVADVMTQAGVNPEVIKKVYTGMQLPEPGKEGTADQVDYKALSAEIMKMPVDTRVKIVNYMKNELKVA